MKFSVDPWDPSYGSANDADILEPTTAKVEVDIEMPSSKWKPLRPSAEAAAGVVLFVDGVRRVEARVWIDAGDGSVRPGIVASFAAGVARCDGVASIATVIVERGLFSSHGGAEAIATRAGEFPPRLAPTDTPEGLSLALQERMAMTEVHAAEVACEQGDAELIVVDGPLKGRQHLPHTVGYVKTHHVAYLPPELHAIVGRMAPGERSPLMCLGTSWSRLSWYLKLPSDGDLPWSGIVRCECSADLPLPEAIALADRVAATVPRFGSQAHKDGRAPQNLYPIAGLERELRRRLGDPNLIYRAIRVAAARQPALAG